MEAAWRRAIELQPTHVLALASFGISLCTRQRLDEALPFLERARQADPLASFPYALTGAGLLNCGRPQEALRYLEDALSFEKEDATALDTVGMARVVLGRLEEGIAALEHVVAVSHRAAHFLERWGGRSRPQAGKARPGRSSRSFEHGRRRRPPSSPRPGCSALSERSMRAPRGGRASRRRVSGLPLLHRVAWLRSPPRRPRVRGVAGEAGARGG